MERRQFLKLTAAAGAAATLPVVAGAGCGMAPLRPDGSPETLPLEGLMAQGARTMWIAPHPDDECFCGSILARSRFYYGNPLHYLVLTHGDGGECCLPQGCHPDVATVRGREMALVAERYRATLRHECFFNAPLPVESFPLRHEIYEKWCAKGDPLGVTVEEIRRFRPDLILTFHPDWGGTGHPEHQLGSRLATTATKLAADPAMTTEGLQPHKVTRVYYMLNRVWLLRLFGRADPGPVTESFDARVPCVPGMDCREFMLEATRLHRTQDNDMGTVRRFYSLFGELDLRQVDPFSELHAPDEVIEFRTA